MNEKLKPRLICIIGLDGVGKTTHALRLLDKLKSNGIRCRYTWFRFFHFLSLPLLVYCRLIGLTVYEEKGGVKIGRHEFHRSNLVSFIYPWLLFIDMFLVYFFKIYIQLKIGYTIICDRFIYDTLVDLMVDLNDPNIIEKRVGKIYLKLIPKNCKILLIDLDEEIICKRRPILVGDTLLATRRKAYQQIARTFDIPVIVNNKSLDYVHNEIVMWLR